MSRTKNVLKNYIWSNINTIVSAVLNFALRTCLVKTLGPTYVGVNALFANILGMLSLAELGIGTAICFSLYEPLAKNDIVAIQKLMSFYKKAYRLIALIVFVFGSILIPFLPIIAKGAGSVKHLQLVYFLYIFNSTTSYLLTYKSTILAADQKQYILNNINLVASVFTIVFQIISLFLWKNYLIYVLISSIVGLIRNIFINIFTTNKYKYLKYSKKFVLEREKKNTIILKVKSLFYHQLGAVILNQTDNIITSYVINVNMVGFVSNYNMIIRFINIVSTTFFSVMAPSIGNLLVTSSKKKLVLNYNRIEFINFIINNFTSLSLFFMLSPFIKIWIGNDNVLNNWVVLVLVINYSISLARMPMIVTRQASGVYEPDKYSPIIESICNLVVSVVLAKKIGVTGIYLGTLVSSFIPLIWCPIVVHKYVLKIPSKNYFARFVRRYLIMVVEFIVLFYLFSIVSIKNEIFNLLFRAAVCLTIPNFVIVVLYKNTDEFSYLIDMFKRVKKIVLK